MPDAVVHHGDALAVMRSMPDRSVDLIVTDPPYFRVKNLPWDRAWDHADGFVAWIGELADEWRRLLRPNGSLYCFASPRMAARVEVAIGERMNVLNSIVWSKAGECGNTGVGRHRGCEKEALRAFFPATERIVFAEHYGADGWAAGDSGWTAKCDELRGFIFEPLRAYLAGEWERAGLAPKEANAATDTQMAGHWFTRSQWALPTAANYAKLRDYANTHGKKPAEYLRKDYEYLRKDYEYLRKDYEDLRKDYEDLRRPFAVSAEVPYTDVWTFKTVPHRPGKHPCEKPIDMLRHMVAASSRPGAVVLDCFCGSGSTGRAAVDLGRSFIGIDADAHWVESARRRIFGAAETLYA